jgi:hypothetical protein
MPPHPLLHAHWALRHLERQHCVVNGAPLRLGSKSNQSALILGSKSKPKCSDIGVRGAQAAFGVLARSGSVRERKQALQTELVQLQQKHCQAVRGASLRTAQPPDELLEWPPHAAIAVSAPSRLLGRKKKAEACPTEPPS